MGYITIGIKLNEKPKSQYENQVFITNIGNKDSHYYSVGCGVTANNSIKELIFYLGKKRAGVFLLKNLDFDSMPKHILMRFKLVFALIKGTFEKEDWEHIVAPNISKDSFEIWLQRFKEATGKEIFSIEDFFIRCSFD